MNKAMLALYCYAGFSLAAMGMANLADKDKSVGVGLLALAGVAAYGTTTFT